jgi:hypothetical protein
MSGISHRTMRQPSHTSLPHGVDAQAEITVQSGSSLASVLTVAAGSTVRNRPVSWPGT